MLKPSCYEDKDLYRLQRVLDQALRELAIDPQSPTAGFIAHRLFNINAIEFEATLDQLRVYAGKYGFRRKRLEVV